jgi:hypothetical protein
LIAEILADGTARTPDAIVAALGENGIDVERAEVNALQHTAPPWRARRAGRHDPEREDQEGKNEDDEEWRKTPGKRA